LCPKIVEFLSFCVEFHWMANFDHPFLLHLNFVLHSFFSHHSHGLLLHTLELIIIINSPNTCNFEFFSKLKRLNIQWWQFPTFEPNPILSNLKVQLEVLYNYTKSNFNTMMESMILKCILWKLVQLLNWDYFDQMSIKC